jgi:hypothetical protein
MRVPRSATVLATALLLAAGVAHASITERSIGGACNRALGAELAKEVCSLQYDGGAHGDASDSCRSPSPRLAKGADTTGLLVPVDDPEDNYGFMVNGAMVNQPVTVRLIPASPLPGSGVQPAPLGIPGANPDLVVWFPACFVVAGESRNLGGAPEEVTFLPRVTGLYTIQALLGPVEVRVGVGGAGDGGDEPGMGANVCHAFCYGDAVNPTAGYRLTVH